MAAMDSDGKAVARVVAAIKPKQDAKIQELVRHLLKGLTPAEFVKLPYWERYEVYYKHLVKRNAFVQIYEDRDLYCHFNPEIAQGYVVRQQEHVGYDAAGDKIVSEARSVYYLKNNFNVPLHSLRNFLFDPLADEPTNIEVLLRNIAVSIRVDQPEDDMYSSMDRTEQKTEIVLDLRLLFKLVEADFIEILVRGGGALDGSDPKTQAKLKEIFPIVKKLIGRFDELFSIRNVYHKPGDQGFTYHDLTPYFSGEELNVKNGKAGHQWGWESWPTLQASKCQCRTCGQIEKKLNV